MYPAPETESGFLKNYTPNRVIEPFEEQPSWSDQTRGDGAGREFATHTGRFDWHFTMRPEKWVPLMNAIRDDASAQLAGNGARILSQGGDPSDGFHFDSKLGKSVGSLTISPLKIISPLPIRRGPPWPEGTVNVTAEIRLSGKWFPKEPGTIETSVNNSPHYHEQPSRRHRGLLSAAPFALATHRLTSRVKKPAADSQ